MQTDDDLQTTLSKWPFVLGDVLLVTTALTVAIKGEWQMTNWQVAFCVMAVALGAVIFVVPYIVEFQVRVREEREDRSADVRVLQRQVGNTKERLEILADLIESLELGLQKVSGRQPEGSDVSQDLSAFSDKLSAIEEKVAEQLGRLDSLNEEVTVLTSKADSGVKPTAEMDELRSGLADLKTQVSALAEKADRVDASEEAIKPPARAEKVAHPHKAAKKSRKRRTSEPRLLKRAIELKQDSASVAVSRIIESKSKPSEDPKAEAQEVEPTVPSPKKEAVQNEEASLKPEATAPDPTPKSEEPQRAVNPDPILSVEPTMIDPVHGIRVAESPKAESAEEPESPKTPELFKETIPVKEKTAARLKRNETGVVASVFIGIGNKPYVRGDGAGLNWETGVAMEFEEIGKWRWTAPVDAKKPFEIQLFRNDEDPDSSGKYTVNPGQRLDVSPNF